MGRWCSLVIDIAALSLKDRVCILRCLLSPALSPEEQEFVCVAQSAFHKLRLVHLPLDMYSSPSSGNFRNRLLQRVTEGSLEIAS